MSRLTTMTPAAVRAMFSPDADSDLIFLLTIYDPDNSDQVVVRLADSYTQRLSETADDVVYGVVSRTQGYIFLPMEISLPTEEEAQAPRCSIVLNDVTRYITPIIRTITGPAKVKMELVLSKTPDTVEASFSGFYISSFNYNAQTVTAELSMIDYEREPFPMHSFSPAYFPGMF
jgi:hypothetical protein